MPPEQWRVLDQAHRKRNLAEYEGEVDVDAELLAAMIRVTRELLARLAYAIGAGITFGHASCLKSLGQNTAAWGSAQRISPVKLNATLRRIGTPEAK